jgi:hypothetical protein
LSNEKNLTKGIQILLTQDEKKDFFFTLNAIILQSMWSTFIIKKSTHYFNSLRQDRMVGFPEKKLIQFMQFTIGMIVLECFFCKP